MPPDDTLLDRRLLTTRIILGSLMMSVVGSAVVLAVVRANGNQPAADFPMMSLVMLPITAGAAAVSAIIPNAIAASARRMLVKPDGSAHPPKFGNEPAADTAAFWSAVYQARLIAASAPLEGCAIAWSVTYFVEGAVWSLAGPAVLLAFMALKFPSRQGLESWIEEQRERLRGQ